jgi:hypothetical protein
LLKAKFVFHRNTARAGVFLLLNERDDQQHNGTAQKREGVMKSKIILGLATIAALALPAVAQQTSCRVDGDGDSQFCVTRGYDAWGNYYERRYTTPAYNGYYNNNYGRNDYRSYNRDNWSQRKHEEHERRERMKHESHEWREHHDGYRGYDR